MISRDHLNKLRIAAEQRVEEREYWLQQLAGALTGSGFPYNHTPLDPQAKSYQTAHFYLSEELATGLFKVSAGSDIRLFIILTAGLTILLYKYSGCENQDILVGSPILKQEVAGEFINTVLALRNQIAEDMRFRELLLLVRQTVAEADKHRNYPIEILTADLDLPGKGENNPLFAVAILLENIHDKHYLDQTAPNMLFSFSRDGGSISGRVEYDSLLYDKGAIEKIIGHFENLLQAAIARPDATISTLDMLAQQEKEQLLFHFNDTGASYPIDRTIHELFEIQAIKTPDNIAVIGNAPGDSRGRGKLNASSKHGANVSYESFTYKELNEETDRLARLLTAKGLKPGDISAVMVERSLHIIVGILAILKSGAAYLPLNPQQPITRTKFILQDCCIALLLTGGNLVEEVAQLKNLELEIIFIGNHGGEPLLSPAKNRGSETGNLPAAAHRSQPADNAANLAYIIYTSGSTGIPKGVPISHANYCPLIHWGYRHLGIGPVDRIIQNLSYYFDWSVWEIFIALTCGASLYMITEEILLDPGAEVDFILENEITVLHITPTQYSYLIETGKRLTSLKYLFIGAEKLTSELVQRSIESVNEECRLFNMYGPTEATIISAVLEIDRSRIAEYSSLSSVPLGGAVANTSLLILDRCMQPCPVGLPGELYIAGAGVARGYLNNPELTAEKFIASGGRGAFLKNRPLHPQKTYEKSYAGHFSPLTTHHSPFTTHLYTTGDHCRWLPDGTVEFLGRVDFQVKIRGYRIEPGEIENLLLKHENVKEAYMMVRQYKNGENYLCAYLVADPRETSTPVLSDRGVQGRTPVSSFRDFLAAQLPAYMVPAHFVLLDRMPLNPNGKIDRNALPEPEIKTDRDVTGRDTTGRANKIEDKLMSIWAEILGVEKNKITGDTNFFELGGHSLKAAQLVSSIYKDFNVNLALAEVFTVPTIRGLAAIIKNAVKEQYVALEPMEKREYYPVTSAQKRLYLVQQWDIHGTAYHISALFMIEGELDRKRLSDTFRGLIARHESFRTSFHLLDEQVVQKIHHPETIEFKIIYNNTFEKDDSLSQDSSQQKFLRGSRGRFFQKEPPDSLEQLFSSFIRPFDLAHAPLLRVGIIDPGEAKNMLAVDIHHIAADGTSMTVMLREFMSLYENGELPALRIQYKDFSVWQQSEQFKLGIQQQEEYWLDRFAEEIPALDLPADYARPPVQSFDGDSIKFSLDKETSRELKLMAQQSGATLYMALLGLYTILLSRLSGEEDIVVGTVTAGRIHEDLAPLIGMFVNTLPIRNFPVGEITVRQFLGQVKDRLLEAFANQDYPYEELIEHLQIPRETSRNPLFDTVFVFQDFAAAAIRIPGLELQPYYYDPQTAKFDITMTASAAGEEIDFDLEYCVKLFKPGTCERIIGYFKNVVYEVLGNPGKRLAEIEIIPEEEKQRLVYEYNETAAEYRYSLDKTIHEIFASRAHETPGFTALVFEDSHTSYACLDMQAHSLAGNLLAMGLLPGEIAAILVERSPEMIIGLLAVLKAGAVYLPLSFQYPDERIKMILSDSRPRMLLTCRYPAREYADSLSGFIGDTIYIEYIDDKEPAAPGQRLANPTEAGGADPSAAGALRVHAPRAADPLPAVGGAAPAYVIYTSGTTGIPKGILVEHRNVLNMVGWYGRQFNIRTGTRILQSADYIFDAGVEQIFGSLAHGAALYLVPKDILLSAETLRQYIATKRIQVIDFVPPVLKELLVNGDKLESLQTVISGADRLEDDVKEKILQKGYSLYNLYGPSETTVDALASGCSHEKVNLGQPIANVSCYILDKDDLMSPTGVPGELMIAGAGVSRGYLNKPDSTGEKFTPDPFFPARLMYRSGDRCRRLPNGNIEFLGRIDQQAKIRGYRIEPAEIENILLKHGNINEAVVISRQDKKGDNYLCAYIVSDLELTVLGLREYLLKSLPEYMIPSYFVQLEKIPLTAAGKIDRRALPERGVKVVRKHTARAAGVEKKIAKIWSQVLEIKEEKIDIQANFFELGGHSLKAAVIVSKINKELNAALTLNEFFKAPTISGLADSLETTAPAGYKSISPLEKRTHYEISSAQNRLYILQQIDVNSTAYNMPAFFIIQGKLHREKFEKTIQGLIDRHETLRTFFCEIENETFQRIARRIDFYIDYGKIAADLDIESNIKNFVRPFALNKAPLLRVALLEHAQDTYFALFDIHHIISDGSSMEVLIAEFARLYEGASLPPLRVQYKDYAARQNSRAARSQLSKQEKYWLRQLAGFEFTRFPIDHFQSPGQAGGRQMLLALDEETSARIETFCKRRNITRFVFLITVFMVALSRQIEQTDITIGVPASIRNHVDVKNLIGIFLNVILIRSVIDENDSFVQLLWKTGEAIIKALDHQDYPYELLHYKMREHGYLKEEQELFSILFNYFPRETDDRIVTGDFEIRSYEVEEVSPKYDMTLYVYDNPQAPRLNLVYNAALYEEYSMRALLDHFLAFIRQVLENEEIEISRLVQSQETAGDDFDAEFGKYY